MTPTPPSTNSSAGARSPEEQYRVVRKRNRVPLSCYPCRTRKLKCDRSHPCSNCTKREGMDTSSCSYASPTSRKKSSANAASTPDDMQNRIDRLEGLVLSLMHNGGNIDANTAAAAGAAQSASQSITDSGSSAKVDREEPVMVDDDSDIEDGLATSLGVLKVDSDKGKAMYIGQEHWHSLLTDIAEVKNYFISHKKELESSFERVRSSKPMAAREGPTLLLGAIPASEAELREALPPRSSVLTLCSRYFNSMDNAVNIIHGPTFQQQLRTHWQDPSKTPIMWLALLYSILTLAMLSYHKVGDEPPEWKGRTLEMSADFRLRTVQCLMKADYTKPVEYTVETMILYVFGEYSSRWDADLGLWMIVSLIVRIAYRMGYHRDAKWFPSITPFQAEMRRRTWALVRMSDVIFSHQVSLPSMIFEHDCDTQLPSNIFDDEFHPGTKQLPPSRPLTEPTPISYMIAKSKLCNELGNILQANNGIGRHIPYDEIIRFDAKLRQIMQELPPHLKLNSLEGTREPVTLIIARFNVDILCQKILCLLHRKYLPRARNHARYAHSRRSAIEASLRALDHLSTLNRESQSDGRLRSVGWYVKSIATKDFTLPAMLLMIDLHYDNLAKQAGTPQDNEGAFLWSDEQRQRMIRALEEAKGIWKALADTSVEAYKASTVIEIMMQKINEPGSDEHPQSASRTTQPDSMSMLANNLGLGQTPAPAPSFPSPSAMADFNPTGGLNPFADSSAFMGMDFGPSPPAGNAFSDGFNGMGAASPFSMFGTNADGSTIAPDLTSNFDWGSLENFAQVTNWGADQSFQIYGGGGEGSSEQTMNAMQQ